MAVLPSPRGLIIDLITPLKKSGDIDGRGLGRHLDGVLPYAQALLLASPHIGEGKGLDAGDQVIVQMTVASVGTGAAGHFYPILQVKYWAETLANLTAMVVTA